MANRLLVEEILHEFIPSLDEREHVLVDEIEQETFLRAVRAVADEHLFKIGHYFESDKAAMASACIFFHGDMIALACGACHEAGVTKHSGITALNPNQNDCYTFGNGKNYCAEVELYF